MVPQCANNHWNHHSWFVPQCFNFYFLFSDLDILWSSPVLCLLFYFPVVLPHQLSTLVSFSNIVNSELLWAKILSAWIWKSHNISFCSFFATFSTTSSHHFFITGAPMNHFGGYVMLLLMISLCNLLTPAKYTIYCFFSISLHKNCTLNHLIFFFSSGSYSYLLLLFALPGFSFPPTS